jgi:xylulose-5-phosphate/fructose-6-phosphate phosphoketolase
MNKLDRFHLVIDVCDKIEHDLFEKLSDDIKYQAVYLRQEMASALIQHHKYITEFGVDMPEIVDWKWDVEN